MRATTMVVVACALAACGKDGPAQQTAVPAPAPAPAPVEEKAPPAPAPAPEGDEISVTSKSPEAVEHFNKGRDLADTLRNAEAVEHFKKALEIDPSFALALSYLGGNTPGTEGAKLIDRSVELAKGLPEPERNFIEANQALSQSDLEKGKALLRKVVQAKPKDWRAQLALGQLAFGDEEWDEAVASSRKAVEASPKAAPAWNYVAYGLAWQGRYDDAIEAAKKQVELLPEEPNSYDTLGEILLAAGKLDDAQKAFETATAKSDKFTLARVATASIRIYKKDWKGAYDLLQKAHDAAPRTQDAFAAGYAETWALAAQGKTAAWLKVYDEMLQKGKAENLGAFVAANRGFMIALTGKPADAIKALDAADADAKEMGLTWAAERNRKLITLQGRLLAAWKMKKPAEVEKAYAAFDAEEKKGQMVRLERSNLDWGQGLVAWSKGDAKAAVESMKKCSQFDYLCRFMLVSAQRAAGDKKGAAGTLAALKASPRRDPQFAYLWATTK